METISRKIMTELSTYLSKSRNLKENTEKAKFYSPSYTVKTIENSNLLSQFNTQEFKNVKLNSIKKKIQDNSLKIVNTQENVKKEIFKMTENNSTIFKNKNENDTQNKMVSTDFNDARISHKNISFYHQFRKVNCKSKDEMALINLNHFLDKCDEEKNTFKRPSSTVNLIKTSFNKKKLPLKIRSTNSPHIFDIKFPHEPATIQIYKRGYLVSKTQYKYFKKINKAG